MAGPIDLKNNNDINAGVVHQTPAGNTISGGVGTSSKTKDPEGLDRFQLEVGGRVGNGDNPVHGTVDFGFRFSKMFAAKAGLELALGGEQQIPLTLADADNNIAAKTGFSGLEIGAKLGIGANHPLSALSDRLSLVAGAYAGLTTREEGLVITPISSNEEVAAAYDGARESAAGRTEASQTQSPAGMPNTLGGRQTNFYAEGELGINYRIPVAELDFTAAAYARQPLSGDGDLELGAGLRANILSPFGNQAQEARKKEEYVEQNIESYNDDVNDYVQSPLASNAGQALSSTAVTDINNASDDQILQAYETLIKAYTALTNINRSYAMESFPEGTIDTSISLLNSYSSAYYNLEPKAQEIATAKAEAITSDWIKGNGKKLDQTLDKAKQAIDAGKVYTNTQKRAQQLHDMYVELLDSVQNEVNPIALSLVPGNSTYNQTVDKIGIALANTNSLIHTNLDEKTEAVYERINSPTLNQRDAKRIVAELRELRDDYQNLSNSTQNLNPVRKAFIDRAISGINSTIDALTMNHQLDKAPAAKSRKRATATKPEAKPAATKPEAQPAASKPEAKPAASKPEAKPAASKPEAKPAASKPEAKPAAPKEEAQPAATKEEAQPAATKAETEPSDLD